jgi:hypothetical protein
MLETRRRRLYLVRREGAPAPRVGFGHRSDVALGGPVCLRLLLNLVNDHPARLVVRERLLVIAVARMHPHA